MPDVSIIIPTYKHRDYVLQALASAFAQSFDAFEVIVINDGSPDDTAEVLQPLVVSGRIRYIEQANGGQAVARNRGIAEARGEYIALLDDDDLWPLDKLRTQVTALENDRTIGVIGGGVEFFTDQGITIKTENVLPDAVTFETLFQGCPFWSPGQTLIRSDVLKKVGGFNERIWGADDYDLWLRLARQTKLVISPQTALLYRIHATNASRDMSRMLHNCLEVIRLNLPYAPRTSQPQLYRNVYRWLYDYIGKHLMMEMRHSLKSHQFRAFASNAQSVSNFVIPALNDPKLLQFLLRDFFPARFASRQKR